MKLELLLPQSTPLELVAAPFCFSLSELGADDFTIAGTFFVKNDQQYRHGRIDRDPKPASGIIGQREQRRQVKKKVSSEINDGVRENLGIGT